MRVRWRGNCQSLNLGLAAVREIFLTLVKVARKIVFRTIVIRERLSSVASKVKTGGIYNQ